MEKEKPKRKLKKIWDNRKQIWAGLWNKLFKSRAIEKIAKDRLEICRSNRCGYHDPKGQYEKSIGNGGKESCGACGCLLQIKVRSLDSECGLSEVDKTPLWNKVSEV